jgi:hypothetical protein
LAVGGALCAALALLLAVTVDSLARKDRESAGRA